MKKYSILVPAAVLSALLPACQANYIHDIRGGNVAPSSSTSLTGVSISQHRQSPVASGPPGTTESGESFPGTRDADVPEALVK